MATAIRGLLVDIGMDVAHLRRDMGQASNEIGRFVGQTKTTFKALGATMVASMAIDVSKRVARELWDAGVQAQRLQRTFESVGGDAKAAEKELEFLRTTARDLGLDFGSTAQAYKGLAAASKNTALQGKATRDIFLAVSEASTVLGLSADQTRGSLYAISQMISKGSVQAEELRGQLGERLPGAFQMAAEAMGVTTQQLGKMLEKGEVAAEDLIPKLAKVLHDRFGKDAKEAAGDAGQAMNRFNSELLDLKMEMAGSGFLDDMVDSLNTISDTMKDPEIRSSMVAIASLAGDIAKAMAEAAAASAKFMNFVGSSVVKEFAPNIWGSDTVEGRQADSAKQLRQLIDFEMANMRRTIEANGPREDIVAARDNITRFKKQLAIINGTVRNDVRNEAFGNELSRAAGYGPTYEPVIEPSGGGTGGGGKGGSKSAERLLKERRDAEALLLEDIKRNTLSETEFQRFQLEQRVAEYQAKFGDLVGLEEWRASEIEQIQREEQQAVQRFQEAKANLEKDELTSAVNRINEEKNAFIQSGIERAAAEQWAQQAIAEARIEHGQDWTSGAIRAIDKYYEEITDKSRSAEELVTNTTQALTDTMLGFLETGRLEVTDFINDFISQLARMMIQDNFTKPLMKIAGAALTGLVGGGETTVWESGTGMSWVMPNAHGNMFGPGGLIPFAHGGIVNRPTIFPFAKGTGLMGEAGPEAIMPLTRTPGGDLGVKAIGGDGGGISNLTVHVVNESGHEVKAKSAKAEVNMQEMVVTLWLDAYNRDVDGLRTAVGG
jgi:lambda family phage tail tape measure protein